MASGDSFLDTLDHTLDDWREGNFSWPENWTWGSNVDEQNKGKQTMANRYMGADSSSEPSYRITDQFGTRNTGADRALGNANNAISAFRRAQGNSTGSGFGNYGNVFKGGLNDLTTTLRNPSDYPGTGSGLSFGGRYFGTQDQPLDLPKGSIDPGFLEGIDMDPFTFSGGADDDNTSWGSGDDKGFDWLGWSQVASGLGQAASDWRKAGVMEKQLPILQGELDFKKASFREKQDKYDIVRNNAINQQIKMLESDFYNDPTRAASLRTV